MEKWEYKIVKMGLFFNLKKKEDELNRMGEQGWELLNVDSHSIYWTFKRRKNKF